MSIDNQTERGDGEEAVTTRNPHDLNQIRPSAELDHPHARPARGGAARRQSARVRGMARAPRAAREGWSLPRKLAATVLGLVVLVCGGGAGLLYFVSPAEIVRGELIRQVKANTGRDLSIKGRAGLVFYPNLGVTFAKIQLSGPPGMQSGPTLSAERIDLSVALLPLLSRKVQVEHIALVRPVVDLTIDAAGRRSWQFAAHPRPQVRLAALGAGIGNLSDAVAAGNGVVRTALPDPTGGLLDRLELCSLALTKAVIRYRDERSGISQRIDDLDMRLNGRRIADPLKARGSLVWQNERLTFDARLDTISLIMAGRAANAHLTLSGRPLSAGFDGTIKLGDAIDVTGQTRASGDSVAATARWLGLDLPNAAPLGGFQISGRLVGNPQSVALNGAALSLGQAKANGVVLVALRAKRPYLSADLNMSDIDVDRMAAAFADARVRPGYDRTPVSKAAPASGSGTQAAGTHAAGTQPQSIEDLLRRSQETGQPAGRRQPQVRGYTNRNEWSAEPIYSSALGLLDAKARLRVDGLKIAGLAVTRSIVRLALADGEARVDIDDIQLYGGQGKGVITAKTKQEGIGFGANLRIDKVAAKELLRDAAGFERIDGNGNLAVVVSGTGASQKTIAESIAGTAKFAFSDGSVAGWNIAKIMHGLQRGQLPKFEAAAGEQTNFNELAASFQITGGRAVTNDLRLRSLLLSVAGQGEIGIGARNLDLALRPKLLGPGISESVNGSSAGFAIPVKLKGPWHDPRILPDMEQITKNPSALFNQAPQSGQDLKPKSVGDIVRGVLGSQ